MGRRSELHLYLTAGQQHHEHHLYCPALQTAWKARVHRSRGQEDRRSKQELTRKGHCLIQHHKQGWGSGSPSFWLSPRCLQHKVQTYGTALLTKVVSRSQDALTLHRVSGSIHRQASWGTTESLTEEEKQLLFCLAQKRKMSSATSTLNWIQDRERMTLQSTGEILPKMLRRGVGERNTSAPNLDKPLLSK